MKLPFDSPYTSPFFGPYGMKFLDTNLCAAVITKPVDSTLRTPNWPTINGEKTYRCQCSNKNGHGKYGSYCEEHEGV